MGPPSRHAAVAVAPSPTLLNVWVREIYHIFPSLKIAYLRPTGQLIANTRFSRFWWRRRNVAPCRCKHLIDYQRVAAFCRACAYPHPTATWVIPSRQVAKNAKAVLSKSRTTRIPFLTKTRKLLAVMIFLSPSRKGRKGCAQQITDNVYSFLTKTIKTLAAMQGLRPLFLSGTVVLRSKLRPAGTRKKQPSFLRLASRQGKPEKPLMPLGLPHLHRIYLQHTATSC